MSEGPKQRPDDPELEVLTRGLERYERRWRLFLRVRACFGLLLLALAFAGAALTAAFLGAALGLSDAPALTRWTSGFDAVLAVFMPAAFTWLCAKTGYLWWARRHEVGPTSLS